MQMTLLAVVTLSPALSPKAIFAPLVYRCIIQAAEKFADLAQRFAPKPVFPAHFPAQIEKRRKYWPGIFFSVSAIFYSGLVALTQFPKHV